MLDRKGILGTQCEDNRRDVITAPYEKMRRAYLLRGIGREERIGARQERQEEMIQGNEVT